MVICYTQRGRAHGFQHCTMSFPSVFSSSPSDLLAARRRAYVLDNADALLLSLKKQIASMTVMSSSDPLQTLFAMSSNGSFSMRIIIHARLVNRSSSKKVKGLHAASPILAERVLNNLVDLGKGLWQASGNMPENPGMVKLNVGSSTDKLFCSFTVELRPAAIAPPMARRSLHRGFSSSAPRAAPSASVHASSLVPELLLPKALLRSMDEDYLDKNPPQPAAKATRRHSASPMINSGVSMFNRQSPPARSTMRSDTRVSKSILSGMGLCQAARGVGIVPMSTKRRRLQDTTVVDEGAALTTRPVGAGRKKVRRNSQSELSTAVGVVAPQPTLAPTQPASPSAPDETLPEAASVLQEAPEAQTQSEPDELDEDEVDSDSSASSETDGDDTPVNARAKVQNSTFLFQRPFWDTRAQSKHVHPAIIAHGRSFLHPVDDHARRQIFYVGDVVVVILPGVNSSSECAGEYLSLVPNSRKELARIEAINPIEAWPRTADSTELHITVSWLYTDSELKRLKREHGGASQQDPSASAKRALSERESDDDSEGNQTSDLYRTFMQGPDSMWNPDVCDIGVSSISDNMRHYSASEQLDWFGEYAIALTAFPGECVVPNSKVNPVSPPSQNESVRELCLAGTDEVFTSTAIGRRIFREDIESLLFGSGDGHGRLCTERLIQLVCESPVRFVKLPLSNTQGKRKCDMCGAFKHITYSIGQTASATKEASVKSHQKTYHVGSTCAKRLQALKELLDITRAVRAARPSADPDVLELAWENLRCARGTASM
jgi:hypothetical protein